MTRVKIVGAGQLGSRHLQALKAVERPLEIHVIDPSEASLQVAKERYEGIGGNQQHQVSYSTAFAPTGATDIAIVATGANVRRKALDALLDASEVRYVIAEKLLFNDRMDYDAFARRLEGVTTRVWVNCPMRVMPVYQRIREERGVRPVSYRVTGSQFGLVTNAIHYLDHAAHLSGCYTFDLDLTGLDRTPIPSKRAGFSELNGTLVGRFADGSRCEVACYPTGNAPVVVELFDERRRYVVRESEGKLWYAGEDTNWAWQEQDATIPFQSQLTTKVVEQLLADGTCGLTPYAESMRLHRQLLDPLATFVGDSAVRFT